MQLIYQEILTSAITYRYTVQAGDSGNVSLLSNAGIQGEYKDIAGNILVDGNNTQTNNLSNADLNTVNTALNTIVLDGIVPTILSVTSSTNNGSYKAGDSINIQVIFSETIVINGTPPQLSLALTDQNGTAITYSVNYQNLSTVNLINDAMNFTYVVQPNQNTTDLDYTSVNALDLSGATIKDVAGNSANTQLPSPGPGQSGSLSNSKNIIIDTIDPTITSIEVPNGTVYLSQDIDMEVTFSEVVNVVTTNGTPEISFNIDNPTGTQVTRKAIYNSGSGQNKLIFKYTVATDDDDNDGISLTGNSIDLNSGTITDVAGNNAVLTHNNNLTGTLLVDTDLPSLLSVTRYSDSGAGSKYYNNNVKFVANFSKALTLTPSTNIPANNIKLWLNTQDANGNYTFNNAGFDNAATVALNDPKKLVFDFDIINYIRR